jgi:glutaredoxin 3
MTVTIYTLDNCGYCKVAKELLKFKQVSFNEVHVPQDMTSRDFVTKFPNTKQFPLILDEDSMQIGGFKDLQEWLLMRDERELLNEKITGLSL